MSNKLTDKEIVKALECCPKNIICGECPLCGKKDCMNKLYINALDLINRLQAENEDYKALYEGLKAEHIETIKAIKHCKAEAYKEFAERLKEKYPWKEDYLYSTKLMGKDIDNLLKELIGE